jgi:hypothetical protein
MTNPEIALLQASQVQLASEILGDSLASKP